MAPLWSWSIERRATRAHIRHFIADAIARKSWATTKPADWQDASDMSRLMLANVRTKTVRQLARESMDYARHRAFMRGAYAGYPGDRVAHELWNSLMNADSEQ